MKMMVDVLPLQLASSFVSHKGVTPTQIEHLLVTIKYQKWRGYGVAVPAKEYGTTVANLRQVLTAAIERVQRYEHPRQLAAIMQSLASLPNMSPTALSAVDMALHDLMAKTVNMPLHRLWGLSGRISAPSAVSIGILPLEETLQEVRRWADWPIIKLKMSRPDVGLLRAVRQHYQGRIWIDGNGAWSLPLALETVKRFSLYGVELIEQPVATGHFEALRQLSEASDIAIIADEDCKTLNDVRALAGYVDGINIKLLKCGGLHQATAMVAMARQQGLKVMLGCKTESALGVTAIAQLARLADYLDLDGHQELISDPFVGLTLTRGRVQLPDDIGLGVVEQHKVLIAC